MRNKSLRSGIRGKAGQHIRFARLETLPGCRWLHANGEIVDSGQGDGGGVMKVKIAIPKRGLEGFCQRWEIAELALFGSALREDFGPGSDIDLLVRFQLGARRVLRPAAAEPVVRLMGFIVQKRA